MLFKHFVQNFVLQSICNSACFSAEIILQITRFRNSTFRKIHKPCEFKWWLVTSVFVMGKLRLLDVVRWIIRMRLDAPDAYYANPSFRDLCLHICNNSNSQQVWQCQNELTAGRNVRLSFFNSEYSVLGAVTDGAVGRKSLFLQLHYHSSRHFALPSSIPVPYCNISILFFF